MVEVGVVIGGLAIVAVIGFIVMKLFNKSSSSGGGSGSGSGGGGGGKRPPTEQL